MRVTHQDLMQEPADQFRPILENNPEGVCIWPDESHRIRGEESLPIGHRVAQVASAVLVGYEVLVILMPQLLQTYIQPVQTEQLVNPMGGM